jgi:hypothetical protein
MYGCRDWRGLPLAVQFSISYEERNISIIKQTFTSVNFIRKSVDYLELTQFFASPSCAFAKVKSVKYVFFVP